MNLGECVSEMKVFDSGRETWPIVPLWVRFATQERAFFRRCAAIHDSLAGCPMKILRIVANIAAADTAKAQSFYQDFFGLDLLMDHGWIRTFGSSESMKVQVSVATEVGSGNDVPDLSIEVDDLAEDVRRAEQAGIVIVYGPADEPWGVRRFYVRVPFGKLVNILEHHRASS